MDAEVTANDDQIPDDSPIIPQPSDANIDMVTTFINNPDNPPTSHEFYHKFKKNNSDPLLTWESFHELKNQFIKLSQDHVNLKDPVPSTEYRQQNPANPKFIQALYRRNRRRAIRKIVGEGTWMCGENPNDLANYFFNDNQPDYDLSIYDDWEVATSPVQLEKFTPLEVQSRLSNAENTSPGLDRLPHDL